MLRKALGILLSVSPLALAGTARAEPPSGWVDPFTRLRPSPVALEDARAPTAERVAAARALGRHGPETEAVAALLDALEREPLPAVRDEILLALARRAAPAALPALLSRLAAEGPKPPALGVALAASGDGVVARALVAKLTHAGDAAFARDALAAMGARAVPALREALATPSALPAARVLERLGADAAEARGALEQALAHAEPEVALAAARTLGEIADARSEPALERRLHAAPRPLALAILAALERLATSESAATLVPLAEATADPERRALALRALGRADTASALPRIERALADADARVRAAAEAALLSDAPAARFAPSLVRLAREQNSEAALSALARIAGGAGVSALVGEVGRGELAARALAIALRRFGPRLPDEVADGAWTALRGLAPGPRRLLLRGLARDPRLTAELPEALRADTPALRAAAAQACALLGDRALAAPVRDALARERDPEALRRLSDAARLLGAVPDPATLARLVRDPKTASEALALWTELEHTAPARALRLALRSALGPRSTQAARAGAALALARLGDRAATASLGALLLEPAARLRAAAVHALASLDGPRAERMLAQHLRVEQDPSVHEAARPASPEAAADHVLELRVRTDAAEPPLLEIWLDDGRCIRQRALPGGELLIADLPEGTADVRVID